MRILKKYRHQLEQVVFSTSHSVLGPALRGAPLHEHVPELMQASVQPTNRTLAVSKGDAAWKQTLARLMHAAPATDRSPQHERLQDFKMGIANRGRVLAWKTKTHTY
jgi:hypothetical protein